MPFEIVRNDIVNMQVDAVVNTANPNPVIGSGVDSGIHKKAGHELLAARQKIGCIEFGDAVITPGFGLDAKYVIHTVGPIWEDGNHGEEQILSSCYRKSLALAKEHECESIAFPLIATGNYGFPKPLALNSPTLQARYDYWVAFNDYAFQNNAFSKQFNKRKASTDHCLTRKPVEFLLLILRILKIRINGLSSLIG